RSAWTTVGGSPPAQPPNPSSTQLVFLGATSGEFNDPLPLGALLTDGSGNALSGRTVSFVVGAQTLSAATDSNGIARTILTPQGAPGSLPLTVSFAGDATQPAASVAGTINIDREETFLR